MSTGQSAEAAEILMLHSNSLQLGWDRIPLKNKYKATVVDLFLSADRFTALNDRTAPHNTQGHLMFRTT